MRQNLLDCATDCREAEPVVQRRQPVAPH